MPSAVRQPEGEGNDRASGEALPFFTVGHSNRSLDAFIALLQSAEIELLVDVRTVPCSRSQPQFNQDTLPQALAEHGIAYLHIAELGGLRGRTPGVDEQTNALWQNRSFHRYADHALGEAFARGLAQLVLEGRRRRCAFMCAEAVWWRCHRRIVADHLLARGETVLHLMGQGRIEPASLTPGAVVRNDGTVVYPAASTA